MKLYGPLFRTFFLAGTTLLLLLLVMAGSADHAPFNEFYWVKADTSNISGAPATTAWTYWGRCDYNNFKDCTYGPAYPISPVDNFHTTKNVPQKFVDDRNDFYYLSRFTFVFLLISLCFSAVAFILSSLSFFFDLVETIVVILVVLAMLFIAAFCSTSTACTVLTMNAFNDDNLSADIGVDMMAMSWTAFTTTLLVLLSYCFPNIRDSYKSHMTRVHESQGVPNESAPVVGDDSSFTRAAPPEDEVQESNNGGIRFFKIKRNNQKVSDDESL